VRSFQKMLQTSAWRYALVSVLVLPPVAVSYRHLTLPTIYSV